MNRRVKATLGKYWVWYDLLANFAWALSEWIIPSLLAQTPYTTLLAVLTGPVGTFVFFIGSLAIAGLIAHQKYEKLGQVPDSPADEKPPTELSVKGGFKYFATVLFAAWPILSWVLPTLAVPVINYFFGAAVATSVLTFVTGGAGALLALGIATAVIAGIALYRHLEVQSAKNRQQIRQQAEAFEPSVLPSNYLPRLQPAQLPQYFVIEKRSPIEGLFSYFRPWNNRPVYKPINNSDTPQNKDSYTFQL